MTCRHSRRLPVRGLAVCAIASPPTLRASSSSPPRRSTATEALAATQQRYQVGAATLVEVTQSRAAQVEAASALVSARYGLVFQQALMSSYTGGLAPDGVSWGA